MGKSAALSNFHLKADQDVLASYAVCCQTSNIISTIAQTKRCWAGPSQFIRVWIQRRIRLVLLESRSDICPVDISSASNGKIILQTFPPGFLTPRLGARMHSACGGRWHLEPIPARPDTFATLHTSTAIIIMGVAIRAVDRGISRTRSLMSAPKKGGKWRIGTAARLVGNPKPNSVLPFQPPTQPQRTDICPSHRRLHVCARGQGRGTATRIRIHTQERPTRGRKAPFQKWSGWTTKVPSAWQRRIKLKTEFARVDK